MQQSATTPKADITDVTSPEAWELLKNDPAAVLVDVRTMAEWAFVGMADLSSLKKSPLTLCWKIYPSMELNPDFVRQLKKHIPEKDTPLLFMCRSGGRSHDAGLAVAQQGYTQCYNVSDGFEGHPDTEGHRNSTGGWKASKLPWRQT